MLQRPLKPTTPHVDRRAPLVILLPPSPILPVDSPPLPSTRIRRVAPPSGHTLHPVRGRRVRASTGGDDRGKELLHLERLVLLDAEEGGVLICHTGEETGHGRHARQLLGSVHPRRRRPCTPRVGPQWRTRIRAGPTDSCCCCPAAK
jgi:hypothetical protein